jgi:hypothetical protein
MFNSRSCKLPFDRFCCVCGQFIFAKNERPISEALKSVYLHQFGFAIINQEKKWVSHVFVKAAEYIIFLRMFKRMDLCFVIFIGRFKLCIILNRF